MKKLKNVWSKCLNAVRSDAQLRVGVIGLVILLLIVIFAPVITN